MLLLLASLLAGVVARPDSVHGWGFDGYEKKVPMNKPPWEDRALMARWLVHKNNFTVVSYINLEGLPFGAVVDISDGDYEHSTGRLLLYLMPGTSLVDTLEAHPIVSVSISEAYISNHCTTSSGAELPICAQVRLTGPLKLVPEEGRDEAKEMLFARFPGMKYWPVGHGFQPYEVHPEDIEVLDFYGGAVKVNPKDYFGVDPSVINSFFQIHDTQHY